MRRLVSLTLVLVIAVCVGAHAQESASSAIIGLVTDTTQASLPGATVTVTQVATGAQRVVVTDAEGRFSVPGLRPATYDVKVELSGFTPAEMKQLTLRNGETVRPTLTLSVGTVAEQITVTGETPLLQTSSASVGQVISEKMIEDLPLNGRGVLSLTALSAGVTAQAFNRGTQFGAAGSSRNQYVTVEGGRDSSTNYAIDGVYVRSLRFNNLSLNPPIDAVQEVSLLRNSFSTEYGQGQAVVSIVTKSGTNRLSGSLYEFVRNDAFDARNYFAATKTPFERNQYRFHHRRPGASKQILRLRWLRRSTLHAGTDVPGYRSEPCAPERRFFQSRHADRRSAHRTAVCRESNSGGSLLEICANTRTHCAGAQQSRSEQLPRGQGLRRRRRYGDPPRRPGADCSTQPCSSASCTTTGARAIRPYSV